MGASVYTTDYSSTTNACGIVQGHAYSILSAFQMTDANNTVHNMIMVRNPWGITYYTGEWSSTDSRWTDALVAQVPLSVDPRTSVDDGIMVMPSSNLMDTQCISSVQVGHLRDAEGYTSTWFDQEAVTSNNEEYYYSFTAPVDNSYLYFTVESFFQIYIPEGCWEPNNFGTPLVYIQVTN